LYSDDFTAGSTDRPKGSLFSILNKHDSGRIDEYKEVKILENGSLKQAVAFF